MKNKIITLTILLLSIIFSKAFSKDNGCQFYQMILKDIQDDFFNSISDSIPNGQKIDPINPSKTKTYPIKREIYLDFYVSPDLFKMSKTDLTTGYGEILKLKGSSSNVSRIENPDLTECIVDSVIASRFEKSKEISSFNQSYYREVIIDQKKVLLNPFKIDFTNILYLKDGRAVVIAFAKIGISPGEFGYAYIFKKVEKTWKIDKTVKFSH